MLRKISAALLATALVAGPALAAPPAGGAGPTPAATAPAPTNAVIKPTAKPAKMVKHVRRHLVRHKVGKIKVARHVKSTKMHRHRVAAHVGNPAKAGKGGKSTGS